MEHSLMEHLLNEIKTSEDYQLNSCANKMKDLYSNASDNLTGSVARTIRFACETEAKKRNIEIDYY